MKLIGMRRGIVVPTLDIDLAWHTHMLFPGHYISDTNEMIGYTPDHDDDMPSQRLELRREKTEDLWNASFKDESYYSNNKAMGNSWEGSIVKVTAVGLLVSSFILYGCQGKDFGLKETLPVVAQSAGGNIPLIILAIVASLCCFYL